MTDPRRRREPTGAKRGLPDGLSRFFAHCGGEEKALRELVFCFTPDKISGGQFGDPIELLTAALAHWSDDPFATLQLQYAIKKMESPERKVTR